MAPMPTPIVISHLAARDTPPWRREALERLLRTNDAEVRHVLARGVQEGDSCCVWSRRALEGNANAALLDAESIRDLKLLRSCFQRARLAPWIICPSSAAAHWLVSRGLPEWRIRVIPDIPSPRHLDLDRAGVRASLGAADALLALTPPPVTRSSGAFTAAWACLLAHRVERRLRLVVPGTGREVDRVARLAASVDRDQAILFPGGRFALDALLAAADVGLYLPTLTPGWPELPPTQGVVAAQRAGLPLLETPIGAEPDVHEVARRLLEMLAGASSVGPLWPTPDADAALVCELWRDWAAGPGQTLSRQGTPPRSLSPRAR